MHLIFLQAEQSSPLSNGSGDYTIYFLVAIFVIFYFFMIRPQNKKRKELNQMRENLKKGDSVITIGGIHGKIADVKDDTVVLSIDGNTKMKVDKSSISMDASTKLTEENKA